jgi:hypothetical protein
MMFRLRVIVAILTRFIRLPFPVHDTAGETQDYLEYNSFLVVIRCSLKKPEVSEISLLPISC